MKWFDRWFYKQARKAWKYRDESPAEEDTIKYAMGSNSLGRTIGSPTVRGSKLGQNSMDFSVYVADGGYIVEYKSYDPKTDRHDAKLHIIPEDKELGEGISHIVTIEMLRR